MNSSHSGSSGMGIVTYVVYAVIAIVIIYAVSTLVFKGASQDIVVSSNTHIANPASLPPPFPITSDGRYRIKPGGEYTFSFWVYINAWADGSRPLSVLNITDSGLPSNSLLSVLLYPADPMMAIRLYTVVPPSTDYTKNTTRAALYAGTGSLIGSAGTPQCDIQGIDLQRWLNVTVCTNGRVVDIYYDGKLNRSCVMSSIIGAGTSGKQAVSIGEAGGFQGSFGVMNYYAYALTPDRIYSIYLAGPGGPPSFTSYLSSKLGINLTYSAPATA